MKRIILVEVFHLLRFGLILAQLNIWVLESFWEQHWEPKSQKITRLSLLYCYYWVNLLY